MKLVSRTSARDLLRTCATLAGAHPRPQWGSEGVGPGGITYSALSPNSFSINCRTSCFIVTPVVTARIFTLR